MERTLPYAVIQLQYFKAVVAKKWYNIGNKGKMAFRRTKDRIEYFVACVTEFADAFGLDYQKSFDYLDRHCGMDFLMKCYEAEHTVSFADAVNDLQRVCRRNGGNL